MKLKSLSLIVCLGFALAFFAGSSYAQGRGDSVRPQNANQVETRAGALRSCESRIDAIKTRMTQLVRLAENMYRAFDSIATRVQAFYTNSILPTGAAVPNYDDLLTDLQVKKEAANSAINEASADVNAFSCVGEVSTLYQDFREDMQKVKTSLREYRTSVRNLIVAIRQLAAENRNGVTDTE